MAYKPRRLFKPKRGLDLKSSETMRGEDYLSHAMNMVYDQQGNLTKRPGTHLRVYGIDSYSGMTLFETTDYKGVSKSEVLFLGMNSGDAPRKLIKRTLIAQNSSGSTTTFSVIYNSTLARYEFVMTGGSTATINLGTGLVGGDATIGDVLSLPAIAGMAWSAPLGIAGVPAAFLEVKSVITPTGGSASFEYYSSEALVWGGYSADPGVTPVFPVSNPTATVVNGSVYWYGSHSGTNTILYKYDGQAYYKAGLGYVIASSTGLVANGIPITDTKGSRATLNQPLIYDQVDTYERYVARLAYKDKAGAIHYGDFRDQVSTQTGSGGVANGGTKCFLPGITSALEDLGLDYENARGAKVNGVQNNVTTITVAAGHTLKIGDVAYFWSENHLMFVEREITNIGATSITISSAAVANGDTGGVVSVLDKCIVSNNFYVEYYYVNEYIETSVTRRPNIATLAAVVPMNVIDTSVNDRSVNYPDIYVAYPGYAAGEYKSQQSKYVYEGATSYPPPLGKYVTSASNGSTLLISGNIESDNTIYSSSAQDSEAFYLGRNSFVVDGSVTSLGSSGAVAFVSTNKQTYAVQGDIPNLNFRVEKITENLGVVSAASVCEIDEGAIYFNTLKGPFMLLGGRELKPVGEWPIDNRVSIIEPYFTYPYTTRNTFTYQPSFEVSSAYVVKEKKWIILNVPWNASALYSFNASATFCYDYSMGGWFQWTGVDASCGAVQWDGKTWFAGQGAGGTINLVSMVEPTSIYSYSDHGSAIPALVRSHWENGGDINLYKKFLWLTVFTPPGVGANYDVNVKTYVNYETTANYSFNVPSAQHSSFTLSVVPPAYTVEAKLMSGKFVSLMVELGNNTVHQGLWISGTELDLAGIYRVPSRPGRSDS